MRQCPTVALGVILAVRRIGQDEVILVQWDAVADEGVSDISAPDQVIGTYVDSNFTEHGFLYANGQFSATFFGMQAVIGDADGHHIGNFFSSEEDGSLATMLIARPRSGPPLLWALVGV